MGLPKSFFSVSMRNEVSSMVCMIIFMDEISNWLILTSLCGGARGYQKEVESENKTTISHAIFCIKQLKNFSFLVFLFRNYDIMRAIFFFKPFIKKSRSCPFFFHTISLMRTSLLWSWNNSIYARNEMRACVTQHTKS